MRLSAIATLLLCLVVAAPASAQKPSPEDPQQHAEKTPTLVGELITVDTAAKTFAIKTADGEVKFSYTDKTQIVGAEKLESGLAGTPGTEATVTYDTHGTAKVATRIELKPKK
jgi:hypothetical protein